MFVLIISAEDENKNSKDAVYSYSRNLVSNPSNVIVIDLKPEDAVLSFASVSKMSQMTTQNISLVLHNTDQLKNCTFNYDNFYNFSSNFNLNLVDSSTGQVVCNFNMCELFSKYLQHLHT